MENLEASLLEIQEAWRAEDESSDSPLPASCVVCQLVEKSVRAYLTFLFAEFVNDPALRVALRQARGFCKPHTQTVRDAGDALGIAILYSDLVDQTLTRWHKTPLTPRSRLSFAKSHSPLPCPACHIAQEAQSRYIRALAKGLESSEVRGWVGGKMRMCVAHIEAVCREAKPESAQFLQNRAENYLQNLHSELNEFIRKNDYRFRGEEWGEERDSWLRSLSPLIRPEER
jgi:hypothetical protein